MGLCCSMSHNFAIIMIKFMNYDKMLAVLSTNWPYFICEMKGFQLISYCFNFNVQTVMLLFLNIELLAQKLIVSGLALSVGKTYTKFFLPVAAIDFILK